MDTDLQRAKRTGDPVAELVALTRMPALRSLPPCRHCGRDLSRVEVECSRRCAEPCTNPEPCPDHPRVAFPPCCNGTGRTEWPWRGDTGRLALMAYAGDEAARALGVECVHAVTAVRLAEFNPDRWPLSDWLRGLARWPGALLAAGILAGRAVTQWWRRDDYNVLYLESRIEPALDAATEHHHCGCVESLEVWNEATHGTFPVSDGQRLLWIPFPGDNLAEVPVDAAGETNEPTIRAAICAGLTGWARTGVLS